MEESQNIHSSYGMSQGHGPGRGFTPGHSPGHGHGHGAGDGLNVGEVFRLLRRHQWILALLIFSALLTTAAEHYMFPSYKARTTLFIQSADSNPLQALTAKLSGFGLSEGSKEFPEKYLQYVRSFDFDLRVAAALRSNAEFKYLNSDLFGHGAPFYEQLRHWYKNIPYTGEEKELTDEKIARAIASWVSFGRNGPDSISVLVVTQHSYLALVLANLLIDVAVEEITDHEMKDLNDAEDYLKIQLGETEKRIRETDAAIVDFKRTSKLTSLDQADLGLRGPSVDNELQSVKIQLEENDKLLQSLTSDLKAQINEYPANDQSVKPRSGLARRVAELSEQSKLLRVKREALQAVIDDQLRSQNPHFEQQIFDLKKKMELEYSLFQELKRQFYQIEMQRISVKNRVSSFERARPADVTRNVSLSKKLLVALLAALLLGGVVAFGQELLTPTVKGRRELEELGLHYLGSVPDLRDQYFFRRKNRFSRLFFETARGQEELFLCHFDGESSGSLAFKHIRARIQHLSSRREERIRVITLFSAGPGEGKSMVASNLAACVARLSKRALLIDCDLKHAAVSRLFKHEHSAGLAEVLRGKEMFGTAVRKQVAQGLDLLPAGNRGKLGVDFISSDGFFSLIADLRELYDYVVLDTPDLRSAPEAALVLKHSDLDIIVAAAHQTSMEQIGRSVGYLIESGNQRIYAVLNKVDKTHETAVLFEANTSRDDHERSRAEAAEST